MGAPLRKLEPGEVFGKRTVVRFMGSDPKTGARMYRVVCQCGKEDNVSVSDLLRRKADSCKSCGNTIHGLSQDPIYDFYRSAIFRCENPNSDHYQDYGGRGIQFKFDSPDQILNEIGPKPTGKRYSVGRIDNDGHYEPGNIRWETDEQQNRNTRATKLNEEKVRQIRQLLKDGIQQGVIAQLFGVSRPLISLVKNNRTWKDV